MKNNYRAFLCKIRYGASIASMSVVIMIAAACEDFIKIDPPRTDLVKSTVFTSETTANAAMIDIYYEMNRGTGFISGSQSSITYYASFSSDEQINYSTQPNQEFNDNEITPVNPFILSLWSNMYKIIYKANAILEGVTEAQNLSLELKMQLEGEARFVRAFCHFYLVNLWGDVPLVLTTDYRTNSSLQRTNSTEVYEQIISDLIKAQNLLPVNYSASKNERVRVNSWTATALLSRVYLYRGDWANAEIQASSIINNTTLFDLNTDLTKVFTKNNKEAIWQLHNTFYPNEIFTFYLFNAPSRTGALHENLLKAFEPGDKRRLDWVGDISNGPNKFYFAKKYQSLTQTAEYSTIFRLAEQYLIRAEARAQLNKLTEARKDLDYIRIRANVPLYADSTSVDQTKLLEVIMRERRLELFTEHGHRWLDLKRTNRADLILGPLKGTTWQSTDVLYPIPEYQIRNSSLSQNNGY